MSWVVDTCVVIDLLDDDPRFGAASALRLSALAAEGLVVCPITYVELAPAFDGSTDLQQHFLSSVGIDWTEPWTDRDTRTAHQAWQRHVRRRRRGQTRKRPLADILIGAFATRFVGVITRNPDDFTGVFPDLAVSDPMAQQGR